MRFSANKMQTAIQRAIQMAKSTGRLHYLYQDYTRTGVIIAKRDPKLMEPYFAFAASDYAIIDRGVWTKHDYTQ